MVRHGKSAPPQFSRKKIRDLRVCTTVLRRPLHSGHSLHSDSNLLLKSKKLEKLKEYSSSFWVAEVLKTFSFVRILKM